MAFLGATKRMPVSEGISEQDTIQMSPIQSVLTMRCEHLISVGIVQIIVPFMMFWMFLVRSHHFSVDGYLNWFIPGYEVHLRNSRPVAWAITYLESLLGFSPLHHTVISILLFMAFLSAMGTILSCMLIQANETEHGVGYSMCTSLAISLSFANIFIWEWYTFVESLPWYATGIALAIASINPLLRRNWKSLILAVGLIALVTMTYQIIMPMAGIWAVAIILTRNNYEVTVHTIQQGMRCVVRCILGAVVGIAIPKLMEMVGLCTLTRNGAVGIDTIAANAQSLIVWQKRFWIDGLGFFPIGSQTVLLILAILSLLYGAWCSKRQPKSLMLLLLSLFGCYLLAIVLHLAVGTFSPAPRTLVPIACFWSTLFVCSIGICYECKPNRQRAGTCGSWMPFILASVICALTVAIHIPPCLGATHDHFMANDSDAEWGQAVAREITAYEQTTGTNVTQLVYGNDAFPTYHLTPPLRYAYYGINMRAVPVEWATPYIIEYYGGMDFESVMPIEDETKDELFGAGRDDAEFDESQVVCDGNVAYVLVY